MMKNLLMLFFVSLALSSFAQKKTPNTYSLAGTTWYREIEGAEIADQKITLLFNGAIYEELNEDSPHLDHYWKQKGNKVILSYNSEYAIYKGKMKGDTIKGKAKNVLGKTWTFKMTRVYPETETK